MRWWDIAKSYNITWQGKRGFHNSVGRYRVMRCINLAREEANSREASQEEILGVEAIEVRKSKVIIV
jgi:hypothetical protein